ncbi:MAG: 4-alpha-glucanotransferase, partial [Ginsengibacter sp.]
MKIDFYLRYHTVFGEELFISGNNIFMGDNNPSQAVKLSWLNEDVWHGSISFPDDFDDTIYYNYILKNREGITIFDGEGNRFIDLSLKAPKPCRIIDTWSPTSHLGNVFFTKAFKNVPLPPFATVKKNVSDKINHEFRVKAPLLKSDETICMCGSTKNLTNWNTEDPILLSPEDNWYTAHIFLEDNEWPATYKYGIYNLSEKKFAGYEAGENRIIQKFEVEKGVTIINDEFVNYSFSAWKGAGVSIPVFSLRSRQSMGIGEFTDIKLLVDWAVKVGLKLIQLLPINDTTAHYNWNDSYPYAAISAFALHPIYINLEKLAGNEYASLIKRLRKKQKELNDLKELEYVEVLNLKLSSLKELYGAAKEEFKNDIGYFEFFDLNRDWLVPYAVFSYLRDKYNTADFSQWSENKIYNESEVQELASPTHKHYDEIAFFYFVQYHLHLQMKEVSDYAHQQHIILKGDIPIGVYRHGCDAWVNPSLYNMNEQAGAPPDEFATKGQNWGFPTYNWNEMSKDDYNWWRSRFDRMSNYFDAFRLDHILGFFRAWTIPIDAVEGIMGRFVPAIPVDVAEFKYRNIWFEYDR